MPIFKDVFISYGRKESLHFAKKLYDSLEDAGFTTWFDHVNIPKGDDFQQRIDNGIESAHNFVYVIAPHGNASPFCLKEIELAIKLRKRIIPILHVERDLHAVHPEIGKINWIYGRELEDSSKPLEEWLPIDDFESAVKSLHEIILSDRTYVQSHTKILYDALQWDNRQRDSAHLLVGKERQQALEWLLAEFTPPKQPPCKPTDLHCEFISESRKNAENLMTDCFICYDTADKNIRDQVTRALSRYAITCWLHDKDVKKGRSFERAIEEGIEQADNFLFFISSHSLKSSYCKQELAYAIKWKKRIVPVLVEDDMEISQFPEGLIHLQYIDFTDNVQIGDFDRDIDEIINIIRQDREYYNQHKVLLSRAVRWKQNPQNAFLLRGFNLENAETWLRLNLNKEVHPPTAIHKEFIESSVAVKGQLSTEVFISYSRTDSDFARQINLRLQQTGKTTWFDQESIATGADFQKEIYKGIAASDNFLFILSPDAVASEFCKDEVQYAANLNKRFITVLWRDTELSEMPAQLAAIQWLDFKNKPFDKIFSELIQTLEIDREYAHAHTLWQQRASEWQNQAKSKDFLLNATACQNAENWLKEAYKTNDVEHIEELKTKKPKKQPYPTDVQIEYINHSKLEVEETAERERLIQLQLKQRLRKGNFALSAAVVLLVVSIYFIVLANKNAADARENSDKVLATNLAFQSKKILERDPNQALNMAAEAYSKADDPSPIILQAISEAYYIPFSARHPFYKWQLTEENKVEHFAYNEADSSLAVLIISEREQAPDSILIYSRGGAAEEPWVLNQRLPIPTQTEAFFLAKQKTLLITKPKPYAIHYGADSLNIVPLADTTSILQFELYKQNTELMTYSQEGDIQLFDLKTGEISRVTNKIGRKKSEEKSMKELQQVSIQQRQLREQEKELIETIEKIALEIKRKNEARSDSFPEQTQMYVQQQVVNKSSRRKSAAQLEQGSQEEFLKDRKQKAEASLQRIRAELANLFKESKGLGQTVFSDRETLFEAHISEDGTRILARYNQEGKLLDAANGNEIETLGGNLISLKFNETGKQYLSVDYRGKAVVRNSSGKSRTEAKLRGDNASAQNLFIPKSTLVMSFFTDGQGFLWDTRNERVTKRFALPTNSNFRETPIASPNGEAVAINSGREVWIIDTKGTEKPYRLRALDNTIQNIQFSKSGDLLVVSYQEFTVVYQYLLNQYQRVVYLPYAVNNISFTADDSFIVGNLEDIRKALIRLWPVNFQTSQDFKGEICEGFSSTGNEGYKIQGDTLLIIPQDSDLESQAFIHNTSLQPWLYQSAKRETLVTATEEGYLHFWDKKGNKHSMLATEFQLGKSNITFTDNLSFVAVNTGSITNIWHLGTKGEISKKITLENSSKPAFSPKEELLLAIEAGKLIGRNPADGSILFNSADSISPVEHFVMHPFGTIAATLHPEESVIRMWTKPLDSRVKESIKQLKSSEIMQKLSNAEQILSDGRNSQPFELELIREIRLPFYKVVNFKFSKSGKLIAVAGQNETIVGEVMGSKTWKNTLPNQFSSAFSEKININFSEDERYLLVSEEGEAWQNLGFELLFWDLNSSQLIFRQRLAKQQETLSGINFFPNGEAISVGSYILPTPRGIVKWLEKQPFSQFNRE